MIMLVHELIKILQEYCDPNDLVIIPAADEGYHDIKVNTNKNHTFVGRKETRYNGKYQISFGNDTETTPAIVIKRGQ